jgi:carboxypeptidase C (cathepsin A)
MRAMIIRATLAALLLLSFAPLLAQDGDKSPKSEKAAEADIPPPFRAVTKHRGTFGGQTISYTAIAGDTYVKDKEGKPAAAIFATTYLKDNPEPNRPVTFLFNGGPGSASLWLHMGAFGPKRVNIPNAQDDGAPPYPITANPESLLDVTDLVFIDPVGTGFSKPLGKVDAKTFWGVTADAESVAQFIRLWLTEHGRWNSPKFLGGESYGTTRSAAVTHALNQGYNDVALNGVILISTILDFGLESGAEGNEMQYVVTVPSMAAAAWYHKKAGGTFPNVEPFVDEARAFALGPYAAALLKGNSLSLQERAAIRAQLARFTGLSETYLENANLRVTSDRFYKELLRDRGLTIGRLDARYTGKDYDNAGEGPDNDPSFYGIDAAYPAAVNAYLRGDLGVKALDREYISIGGVRDWDWKLGGRRDEQAYLTVAPYLSRALRENSGMKIFVGQGWYDFATPFFAAEYSLNRPGFPEGRIAWSHYDSGHMMYVQDSDRVKLSNDVRAFIRQQK